jgi:hypothetical protein
VGEAYQLAFRIEEKLLRKQRTLRSGQGVLVLWISLLGEDLMLTEVEDQQKEEMEVDDLKAFASRG